MRSLLSMPEASARYPAPAAKRASLFFPRRKRKQRQSAIVNRESALLVSGLSAHKTTKVYKVVRLRQSASQHSSFRSLTCQVRIVFYSVRYVGLIVVRLARQRIFRFPTLSL